MCCADVAGEGKHEGECVLCGGNGVSGRGVHHDHAVVSCGIAVDVVNAHSSAADGFEIRSGGEDCRGDFRFRADYEAVVIADDLEELVRGHAGLYINGNAFGGAKGFNTFFRNGIGDEDAVVAHGALWVIGMNAAGKRKCVHFEGKCPSTTRNPCSRKGRRESAIERGEESFRNPSATSSVF